MSSYEQESGFTVFSVTVSDVKHVDAGELRAFNVTSWRSGAEVADDSTEDNDSESSQSVGGGDASSDSRAAAVKRGVSYQQTVWRTLKDFRAMHSALTAAAAAAPSAVDALPPFPRPASWLGSLYVGAHAAAAALQRDLDVYMKGLLAHPLASTSRPLLSLLTPSERPDWPPTVGDIDLAVHDLPHASSATEWWYLNAHWKDVDGREYSAFAAFFRVLKHTAADSGVKSYAHALNWALTDVAQAKYVQECVLDRDSPEIVRKQLDTGKVIRDPRLLRAYRETLDRGAVPLPDRMFSAGRDAVVSTDRLALDFESAQLTKDDATGRYRLVCSTPDGRTGVDLTFTPRKAPVRHGLDGVVKGHDGDDMWYYFIPRCDVAGSFTVGGEAKAVAPGSGQGWYDHEFGGVPPEAGEVRLMQYAWTWAALQLDNGVDVSAAVLVDPRSTPHRTMETRAVVVGADGARTQPGDLAFSDVGAPWTSVRTFSAYPVSWRVAMPSAGIDLTLTAVFPDQEFMTLIARPGFWEGRVAVRGTLHGAPVTGVGFVERNGYTSLSELDGFFKAVGVETRRAVADVYPSPSEMTLPAAVELIASKDTAWYVDGVDLKVFAEGITAPVRYITDMGGKSWRSYGALACIDVVGGDARKFTRWLSMPEFLHVGSLIIDDIEDRSLKRRGVDCAHVKFGEPIAINAGCAAYFQSHQLLLVPGLTPEQLNTIYGFYFAALRAGHAGQALDIAGLGYLMDDVIERGDAALAESRLLAIHRLKTAVPAASLARMGALVGGGSPAQVEAIGRYYESVGLAFQIMDDVLNLRGIFSGNADKISKMELKTLGEDITAGKVTMPVVKALTRLPREEMRALWATIKSQPADRAVVGAVIARLEEVGAIDACIHHANDLVEDAYAVLQPLIPDSFSKIMLRAFGYYVAEQSAPRMTPAEAAAAAATAVGAALPRVRA